MMAKTNVVIIGAGPVGCVAAYYLARHGLNVVLVEQGPDCAQDLRASTFHPPTLEMLDTLGLAQPLIEKGLKAPIYHWRERSTGNVFEFDLSEIAGETKFPFRVQCEQYHLARMLAQKLEEEPNARVLFSHRMLGYVETDSGIEVSLESPYAIETIKADYLIGADGANSVVRKLIGVEFDGFTYPEKFLCLTTKEPLEDHLPNLALVNYVSDPKEWTVLLRVPSLWRVLVPANPDDADEDLLSDKKKEQVFGGLIGKPEVVTGHRTIYRVHQRVAKSFRKGRVCIIGDAAHLNNPLGGFGMNSGIHDAFSLCPKLVSILKDGAEAEPLLDRFDRTRQRQTHEFVQSQTKINMEFMRGGEGGQHMLRKQAMERLVADKDARHDYLMRQAMFQSVRAAAAEEAAA
ncbi:MAG: FAD-dependent monooxygenase [Sandarakinorhabdus sp.]|nr:FAD-dependent monooxygenase [Sandarakinorhabdus sp.]